MKTMTKRDKLLKMDMYDLLIKLNCYKCVVENIDKLDVLRKSKRCRKFCDCKKCIQAWLNEKE